MGLPLLKAELPGYDTWKTTPPEDDTRPDALTEWIENAAELLLCGMDVEVRRRGLQLRQVTFDQFAVAVDEFGAETCKNASAAGRMAIGFILALKDVGRSGADDYLGVPDPIEKLRDIARDLVRPLADDGVAADAEDAEYDL